MNEMRLKEIEREFEFYGIIPNDKTDFADLLNTVKSVKESESTIYSASSDIAECSSSIQSGIKAIVKTAKRCLEVAELNALDDDFVKLFAEQLKKIENECEELQENIEEIETCGGLITDFVFKLEI